MDDGCLRETENIFLTCFGCERGQDEDWWPRLRLRQSATLQPLVWPAPLICGPRVRVESISGHIDIDSLLPRHQYKGNRFYPPQGAVNENLMSELARGEYEDHWYQIWKHIFKRVIKMSRYIHFLCLVTIEILELRPHIWRWWGGMEQVNWS